MDLFFGFVFEHVFDDLFFGVDVVDRVFELLLVVQFAAVGDLVVRFVLVVVGDFVGDQ